MAGLGRAPPAVSDILLAAAAVAWLIVLAGYLRYILSVRSAVVRDLLDPVAAPFASLALVTSILGFLLSMAAALGAQVALFQWGWGQQIFGITPTHTISFLPIIMLAIIFGLSSDYEMFVVSRIKEDYTKNGDARRAVQRGTGLSARVAPRRR